MLQLIKLFLPIAFLYSCATIDVYEKNATIPGHAWSGSYKPAFDFQIKDTNAVYNVYVVLRHNERYNYNNIFINLFVKGPLADTVAAIQKDLTLATNDKGWLATGIDDIYEHRILLAQGLKFKEGKYQFALQQIMREDPLRNVINAGIRIEKTVQ